MTTDIRALAQKLIEAEQLAKHMREAHDAAESVWVVSPQVMDTYSRALTAADVHVERLRLQVLAAVRALAQEPEPPPVHVPEAVSSPAPQRSRFEEELRWALNANSKENGSNTPDIVLAQALAGFLTVLDTAIKARDRLYGVELRPGMERGQ